MIKNFVIMRNGLPILGIILLLASCGQSEDFSCYINSDSKYEKRVLKEPFKKIKEDYYQQYFVNRDIKDDKELIKDYFPVEEARSVTLDSILLYGIYGVSDGAYICDFLVNHNYLDSWVKCQFSVNGKEYPLYQHHYINPIVWKDNAIYDIQSAVDGDIISAPVIDEVFNDYPYFSHYQYVESDVDFEYLYYLPTAKDESQMSFSKLTKSYDSNKHQEMNEKTELYKKKLFKKYFYEKGLKDDGQLNNCYIPRLVEPRSILLLSEVKLDNISFVTFTINGIGLSNFCGGGTSYLQYNNHPISKFTYVYHNNDIYSFEDALNNKIFDSEQFEKYWNEWSDHFTYYEAPNVEYLKNLPGLNRDQ